MFGFHSLNDIGSVQDTVILVDDTHRFKDKQNTDIVLIPQPSDDINDPLNWPQWKKNLGFFSIIVFSALVGWVIGGPGVAIVLLMQDFNRDLTEVVDGVISWCILTLGLGNFFWVPTALYFGRRPAFVVAILGFLATTIWSAKATTFRSFVAARVLSAFFGSSTEAIPAVVVKDLFFLHERGRQMGIFILFLGGGGSLGFVLSGFVTEYLSWRWNFWITAILAGVNAIWIILFFPETAFTRAPAAELDPSNTASISEKSGAHRSVPLVSTSSPSPVSTVTVKRSFLEELKPWNPIDPKASYIKFLLRPWPLVVYPALIYSFLVYAAALGWLLCVFSTNASVYQNPPYNMSPSINNLINIPAMIGIIVGSYSGGWVSDRLAEHTSRRNNGVFEPEARLVALILPFIIVPIGLLMYGFAIERHLHWAVGFVGAGLINFGLGAVPSVMLTYLTDSYFTVAADLMLLTIGLKNVFGFGFAYGVIPWVTASGYQTAFGTMVGIHCGIMLLGVPLWYWGKQIRQKTALWKVVWS